MTQLNPASDVRTPAAQALSSDTYTAAPDPRDQRRPAISGETWTPVILFGLTILLILASRFISPGLGGLSQVQAVCVLSCFLMLVGFGQQMVVLIGGLDLSIPTLMTLGGILTFSWAGPSAASLVGAVPGVLLVTALIGALSGCGVALLRIPPFIMTLSMQIIIYSACLGYTGGTPRGQASPPLAFLFAGRVFGINPIIYVMVILIVAGMLLQSRSTFGRKLYALGSNPLASHIAGLPVIRLTIACYAISAVSAGLAGVLMVGYAGGATLVMGNSYLLPSIAAVVVGGTSILGGKGRYISVVAAALLLTTFSTIISSVGIVEAWRTIIYGILILVAVLALREDLPAWFGRAVRRRPSRLAKT